MSAILKNIFSFPSSNTSWFIFQWTKFILFKSQVCLFGKWWFPKIYALYSLQKAIKFWSFLPTINSLLTLSVIWQSVSKCFYFQPSLGLWQPLCDIKTRHGIIMVKVRNGIVKVIEDIVSPIQCCKSNLATFETNVAITLPKTLQEQIHRSSAITPSSSSYDNILRPRGALSKRHRFGETFLPQEYRVRFLSNHRYYASCYILWCH